MTERVPRFSREQIDTMRLQSLTRLVSRVISERESRRNGQKRVLNRVDDASYGEAQSRFVKENPLPITEQMIDGWEKTCYSLADSISSSGLKEQATEAIKQLKREDEPVSTEGAEDIRRMWEAGPEE